MKSAPVLVLGQHFYEWKEMAQALKVEVNGATGIDEISNLLKKSEVDPPVAFIHLDYLTQKRGADHES